MGTTKVKLYYPTPSCGIWLPASSPKIHILPNPPFTSNYGFPLRSSNMLRRLSNALYKKQEVHILVLGLDNSGKSSLIQHMKPQKVTETNKWIKPAACRFEIKNYLRQHQPWVFKRRNSGQALIPTTNTTPNTCIPSLTHVTRSRIGKQSLLHVL